MEKIVTSLVFSFLLQWATAQDSLQNISLHKDARLDQLMERNRKFNEENYLKTLKNMSGYRLQVINTNDRNKALSVKTKMMTEFPGEKTYLIYQAPYFKVQTGNFIKREDAEEFLNKVKNIYPTGVFVVPSRVEVKPTKDGELLL